MTALAQIASAPAASPSRLKRHRWPKRGNELRETYKTIRICLDCGIQRVTRHEPGERPWKEFHSSDGHRIACEGTPECVPVGEGS